MCTPHPTWLAAPAWRSLPWATCHNRTCDRSTSGEWHHRWRARHRAERVQKEQGAHGQYTPSVRASTSERRASGGCSDARRGRQLVAAACDSRTRRRLCLDQAGAQGSMRCVVERGGGLTRIHRHQRPRGRAGGALAGLQGADSVLRRACLAACQSLVQSAGRRRAPPPTAGSNARWLVAWEAARRASRPSRRSGYLHESRLLSGAEARAPGSGLYSRRGAGSSGDRQCQPISTCTGGVFAMGGAHLVGLAPPG